MTRRIARHLGLAVGVFVAACLLAVLSGVPRAALASSADPAKHLLGEALSGTLISAALGLLLGSVLAIAVDLVGIAVGHPTTFDYRRGFQWRTVTLVVAWGVGLASLASSLVTFGGARFDSTALGLPHTFPPSLVLGFIFGTAGVALGVLHARLESGEALYKPTTRQVVAESDGQSPSYSPELRYFLYLDADLISDFLAQLEEGEFETYQLQRSRETTRDASGHAALPGLGVSASQRWSGLERATYSMRLTPASQVARLIRLLRQSGGLKEASDGLAIERGDLLLVGGSAELTGVTRLAGGLRARQIRQVVRRYEARCGARWWMERHGPPYRSRAGPADTTSPRRDEMEPPGSHGSRDGRRRDSAPRGSRGLYHSGPGSTPTRKPSRQTNPSRGSGSYIT